MSAQRASNEGPVARSVLEALEALVSSDKARMVLDVALMLDGRANVPEESDRAIDFVYGPLRKAIEVYLDTSIADAVIERLDPILTMMSSHVRRREDQSGVQGSSAARALPPTDRKHLPLVLIASHDRTGIQGVARIMFGRAHVRQISNVFEMVAALESDRAGSPLIVVDCSLPAIDPSALSSMLPFSRDTRVVLWGATEGQRLSLERAFPFAKSFLAIPGHTSHTELAVMVESLIELESA